MDNWVQGSATFAHYMSYHRKKLPVSGSFLDFEVLRPLIDAYHLDSAGSLASQLDVCKLLLKQREKPRNIPDLISKLNPAGGFPDLRRLLQLALAVPIANVAAERFRMRIDAPSNTVLSRSYQILCIRPY